jgi:hypothetical protein
MMEVNLPVASFMANNCIDLLFLVSIRYSVLWEHLHSAMTNYCYSQRAPRAEAPLQSKTRWTDSTCSNFHDPIEDKNPLSEVYYENRYFVVGC